MSFTPFASQHVDAFATLHAQKLPSQSRTLSRILLIGLILIIAFMTFVPWIQTSFGIGKVSTLNANDRVQQLDAFVGGRIRQWFVRDGSFVKKGEPIVEIMDNDARLIERLKAERDALEQNYKVAQMAADTANINLNRSKELVEEGLASPREYEEARIKYKTLRAKESQALAELKQAEVRLSRQDTQILYAPRDGTILNILSGDVATTVKEGDPMVTFAPVNMEPAVELFIDGMDVPLIHPGRKVRLQFEGWPVVQFSGWPSVSIGTFGGVVKSIDPSVGLNGKFRVIIVEDPDDMPWPSARFLRFGAKVKGWIMLDQVSVGYELWRQLNNFPPEYTQPPETTPGT